RRLARAGRESRYRSVGAVVAKVIEEDEALATSARIRGREATIPTRDGLAKSAREGEALAPVALGPERNHHVQPAPSRGLHPRFEAERGERRTQEPRSLDDLRERHFVARIEVEDDA